MTTLWDFAPHNHTDTSKAAAEAVRSLPASRAAVLDCLRVQGPQTQEEVATALQWPIQSVNPRVNELARMGAIRDTGQRRATRSGRNAAVWEVV